MSDNAIEYAAEEAECVRMVLDDMGVPKRGEDGDLSLVGRVILAIVTSGKPVDPVATLHLAVAEHGSQKAFAERAGVSAQYVNDVLQRRREPGTAITQALGLERITAYRRMA